MTSSTVRLMEGGVQQQPALPSQARAGPPSLRDGGGGAEGGIKEGVGGRRASQGQL